MSWRDNLRGAMTPDGIVAEGGQLVQPNPNWEDYFRNACTPTGIKIAGGGGGTSDFDQLTNRPKVGGVEMTHETDLTIPVLYNVIGDNSDGAISQAALTDMFFASKNGGINIFPQVANKYRLNSTSASNIAIGYSDNQDNSTWQSGSVVIGIGFNALHVGLYNTIIGYGACSNGQTFRNMVAIGNSAGNGASDGGGVGNFSVAIGGSSGNFNKQYGVAIGDNARGREYSVGLGAYARATRDGEVFVGLDSISQGHNHGYNNTDYRVIGGVHDGVNDHDAATVGQLNAAVGDIETALATLNTGGGAQ